MEIVSGFQLSVTEKSAVSEARRQTVEYARILNFNESDVSNAAIIVTEAATNLVKHAVRGEIIIQAVKNNGIPELTIISVDRGPGIGNLLSCFDDGYSTTGTSGTGLGAIKRLASSFDVYSQLNTGTVLIIKLKTIRSDTMNESPLDFGGLLVKKPGESFCGDNWAIRQNRSMVSVMMVDGLGHGLYAAQASEAALKAFAVCYELSPREIIGHVHSALIDSRGAVLAVAGIDLTERIVHFAGIGNISGVILHSEKSRNLISHAGIVGRGIRTIKEFVYPWKSGSMMVLHTDGLSTKWGLDHYPGVHGKSAQLIAALIYRDAVRGNDDAGILIIKHHDRES